jgi:hypothetical protein
MEWQPIETAPRSDERILAFCKSLNGGRPECVVIYGGEGWPFGDWRVPGVDQPYLNTDHDFEPTHWMPLPTPPDEVSLALKGDLR